MCHNLGANYNADPFTNDANLIGDLYQWGQKNPAKYGPNHASAPNSVSGYWHGAYPPLDSWSETTRTANDPCPPGFHVPSEWEWKSLTWYNTATGVLTNTIGGITYRTTVYPTLPLAFSLSDQIAQPYPTFTTLWGDGRGFFANSWHPVNNGAKSSITLRASEGWIPFIPTTGVTWHQVLAVRCIALP